MPCSHLRFLVVEDHPVQRKIAVTLLTNLGAAAVHAAENGREALAVVRDPARPVDIVLSDVSMPDMDGIELVRQLAAADSPIALILNSALEPGQLAAIANLSLAYRVNLLGAINKPLSAVKLVPLVQRFRDRASDATRDMFTLAQIASAWEHEQFEPFFEPRADLSSTEITGFHASPHWRHPERGVLGPAAFMSSVDAFGLHDEMVLAMLRKSIAIGAQWQRRGQKLDLSVTLSLSSLADPGLTERIDAWVQASGIDPARLVLGINSDSFAASPGRAVAPLTRLRRAGFGLAAEDFGTGALWADLLERVRFTHLTISPNLILGIQGDPTARAGLVVSLDTARQHGLAATGRGLKTLDHWNLLQGWGCDYGQGPFVGPPMPFGDLASWLAERGRRAQAHGATGHALDLSPSSDSAPLPLT